MSGIGSNVRLIDVAKRANVSRSSVAQVLLATGGKTVRVSEKTAKRILQAAKELNYYPNTIARQLKGIRSNVIGVIIDSLAPQIAFDRLSEMERQAAKQGYRFMVGQSHGEIERLKGYAQDFSSRGIDGVICISHEYPRQGKYIEEIFAAFDNVVFIGKPVIANDDISFVAVDTSDGIYQACEYLIRNSRKNIGMLLWSSGSSAMEGRLSGYLRAMRMHGISVNENLIRYMGLSDEVSIDYLKPFVRELVEEHHADAIVAVNDKVALMTIRCLEKMGVRIPQDVSVVGFDNIELAELCRPALTTVDQRSKELSQTAVSMLIDLIEGNKQPIKDRQKIIKPRLIIRQSA